MAALWSALPSPTKQKGEKLKQELGVKGAFNVAHCHELSLGGIYTHAHSAAYRVKHLEHQL